MDWSLAATYCGVTSPVTGSIGGYNAAKTLCEAACGSTSAHMCNADEAARSAQVGMTVDRGWITGPFATYPTGQFINDCEGWTTSSSNRLGHLWYPPLNGPDCSYCNNEEPLLCCD